MGLLGLVKHDTYISSIPPTVMRAHCSRRHLRRAQRVSASEWRPIVIYVLDNSSKAHAGVPAASQVGLLVASALFVHMRRGGCHHHEVVGHTSVQRERADGERLQCLVGLRYGDVVEPHIEWCVGFWVILHPKPTLQRTDGVDYPLEVHVLGVGAATRQPLRGKGDDQGESESRSRAEAET